MNYVGEMLLYATIGFLVQRWETCLIYSYMGEGERLRHQNASKGLIIVNEGRLVAILIQNMVLIIC